MSSADILFDNTESLPTGKPSVVESKSEVTISSFMDKVHEESQVVCFGDLFPPGTNRFQIKYIIFWISGRCEHPRGQNITFLRTEIIVESIS